MKRLLLIVLILGLGAIAVAGIGCVREERVTFSKVGTIPKDK